MCFEHIFSPANGPSNVISRIIKQKYDEASPTWKKVLLNQVVFNVLKNPNPLKDDEASVLLDAAVLVLALFWGSSML